MTMTDTLFDYNYTYIYLSRTKQYLIEIYDKPRSMLLRWSTNLPYNIKCAAIDLCFFSNDNLVTFFTAAQATQQLILVLVALMLLLIGIVILDEKMEEKKNCHSQSPVLIDLCVLCS